MLLSRISLVLLATSATISPFASAQGLRKSNISDSKLQISAEEAHAPVPVHKKSFPLLSSLFGTRDNKDDRHLSTSIHYSQMGIDIDGQLTDDGLGKSVAMSKDGLRVAIAAPGGSSGRGVTRVLDWDATPEEWIQVGQDIVGPSVNFGLGWSMDMNEDGSRIVLGAPEANNDDGAMYVYELDENNTWQILGSAINPESAKGQAGVSVTMSATGDRIAFGAPRTNAYSGRVTAFHLVDGQWVRLGQNMDCMEYYAYSGGSIAMDADGTRIVVGGRLGSYYTGYVKVFDYNDTTSQWEMNGYLSGQGYYDRFGSDVDISEDGNRVVIGAYTSDGQSAGIHDTGEFCVMEYDGSTWNILGTQVVGTVQMDQVGDSVIMSGDGTHVAISAPGSDNNGQNAGKVKVYKYSETDQAWLPQGIDIDGECEGDKLGEGGSAVAMDRNGSHLAVGAQRGNYYAGMSRVYEALAGAGDGTGGSTNNCE